jgi:hypothetical protein
MRGAGFRYDSKLPQQVFFTTSVLAQFLLISFRRERSFGADHPDTCASRDLFNELKQWSSS